MKEQGCHLRPTAPTATELLAATRRIRALHLRGTTPSRLNVPSNQLSNDAWQQRGTATEQVGSRPTVDRIKVSEARSPAEVAQRLGLNTGAIARAVYVQQRTGNSGHEAV